MVIVENSLNKKEDFVEKLIDIKRTTKVVKGGRIFSFSVLVIVGDYKGSVGFGMGKAREIPLAIQKASYQARKNIYFIDLYKGTLYYPINYKYLATKIIMLPAYTGTGIIAGGCSRSIFELVGIKNIISKCIGSHCPHNVVMATFGGLLQAHSPEYFSTKRNVSIDKYYFKG